MVELRVLLCDLWKLEDFDYADACIFDVAW